MAGKAERAQAGQGDLNVLAHPSFREIPKCLFALRSKEAKAEYDTLARAMFEAGRLTLDKHRALSSYAMQFDMITRTGVEGKAIPAYAFTYLDRTRNSLGLDKLEQPIAAPASAPVNKFARTGFANRRR